MVKNVVALAILSVVASLPIVGVAVGCSTSSSFSSPVDSGVDATRDAATLPPPDDAEEVDAGTARCPRAKPITVAEIDEGAVWLPPGPVASVCDQASLDRVKIAAAGGGGIAFPNLKAALGADCSKCVFSPLSGDAGTWQLFVEVGSAAIDNATAACFATLTTTACGRQRYAIETCLDIACRPSSREKECGDPATEAGKQKLAACTRAALEGACSAVRASYAAACPTEPQTYAECTGILRPIATVCGGGADAGLDASAPDL